MTPLPSTTATSGVLHPTSKDISVQALQPTSSKRGEQGHLLLTNSGPNEASNPSQSPEAFHRETRSGDQDIMATVTHLLEAQRQMMEAQVQAMAAQSVPPLCKFNGENINTDEGNIDRWVEQFAERARVAGWSEQQKLFQLTVHLEKTAEHTVRMLPMEEKDSYDRVVVALKKRFSSVDIEELRGLEFHQLMQEWRNWASSSRS